MGDQQAGLIQNLYYYIQQRVNADWTTDPSTAVLFSVITCGIYGLYVFYKLMERRDLHFARVANMAGTSVTILKEKAAAAGKTELIGEELTQLDMLQREMYEQSRERGAALWLVLGIFFGIAILFGYYFIMDDFKRHDRLEAQFFTLMSTCLTKLGLSTEGSTAGFSIPERDFVTFLLFTIFTCGIYGFYWMYVMVMDGNAHVEAQAQWEDYIYSALAT